MVTAVKSVAWIFAIAVWAVLGFYVWIPALSLVIVLYAGGALVVSSGSDKFLKFAESRLERNASLYPNGFIRISRGVWSNTEGEKVGAGIAWSAFFAFAFRALLYIVLATIVWICLIALIALISGWPPGYLARLTNVWSHIGQFFGRPAS